MFWEFFSHNFPELHDTTQWAIKIHSWIFIDFEWVSAKWLFRSFRICLSSRKCQVALYTATPLRIFYSAPILLICRKLIHRFYRMKREFWAQRLNQSSIISAYFSNLYSFQTFYRVFFIKMLKWHIKNAIVSLLIYMHFNDWEPTTVQLVSLVAIWKK